MSIHWASFYLGMHFEWPARFVAGVLNDLMQPLFGTAINDLGLYKCFPVDSSRALLPVLHLVVYLCPVNFTQVR